MRVDVCACICLYVSVCACVSICVEQMHVKPLQESDLGRGTRRARASVCVYVCVGIL